MRGPQNGLRSGGQLVDGNDAGLNGSRGRRGQLRNRNDARLNLRLRLRLRLGLRLGLRLRLGNADGVLRPRRNHIGIVSRKRLVDHLRSLRRVNGHRRGLHLGLREIHGGEGHLRVLRSHGGIALHHPLLDGRRGEGLRLGLHGGHTLHGGGRRGEEGSGIEIEAVLLVEEQNGLIGGGDAVVDHGGVVGEVAELGVVALHPVELVVVLVETHGHVVLAVVQHHSHEVVHQTLAIRSAVAHQHSQIQRQNQRLRINPMEWGNVV